MMKRILSLLLVVVMALGLTGCSVIDRDTAVQIAGTLITNALNNQNGQNNPNTQNGQTSSGLEAPLITLAPEQQSGGQSSGQQSGQASGGQSSQQGGQQSSGGQSGQQGASVVRGESYSTKDEVALYIHLYGELPPNYITKKDAQALGWVASKGNLWQVTDHKSIGGDYFGNYEGLLPKANGRKYYECDIGYSGGTRNAKRIIFSNDGLIYYTDDHYKSFTQLYGGK